MVITNWLAKGDGADGLLLLGEFAKRTIRIYGNVYGNPNFTDGEYVQTTTVIGYDGHKVATACGEEYTLGNPARAYELFMQALKEDVLIVKKWSVENGLLLGNTLEGVPVEGKVISQCFRNNVCTFKDGRRVFVDWLSMDPDFNPDRGSEEFFLFGIEKCMPDIFGKHFLMFKRH